MKYNTFLIVHIGGASISGIAEILHNSGKKVYGWEKRIYLSKVQNLIKSGVDVFSDNIPESVLNHIDCVVHSSVATSEYIRAALKIKMHTEVYTQFEFVNLLITGSKSIAITGSYGKTITTTLLSHVFFTNEIDVSFTCGGVSKNFKSNAKYGTSNVWIVEAVETHDNCLHLDFPYGIIINIESSEQIPLFESFINIAKQRVYINTDDEYCKVLAIKNHSKVTSFGINDNCAILRAINVEKLNENITFEVVWHNKNLGRISVPHNSYFSIYNLLSVLAISLDFNLKLSDINQSFNTYLGVEKRFDFVFKSSNISFLFDIAHHPISIKESIIECGKYFDNIIVLYRPHMYKELNESIKETIQALDLADKVIMLDIESVKDKQNKGINSKEFVNQQNSEKWQYFESYHDIIQWLYSITFSNTLILQMGMYLDDELTALIESNFQKQ